MALAAALNLGGFLTTASLGAETTASPHHGYLHRIAQRLDLTDAQKARIKTVLQGERETLKNFRTQLRAARENLQSTIQSSDATETSVRDASARLAAVEANLAVERMKIFAKITPILTDDQLQQLKELEQRANAFLDRSLARSGESSEE